MIRMVPVDVAGDRECLCDWLAHEEWPFHANRQLTSEQVSHFVDEGLFNAPGTEAFWISTTMAERVGLIRIFDLDDSGEDTPRFDLRIGQRYRNQHVGRQVVRWMIKYLFDRWPKLRRIEGTTRHDNFAMQRLFLRCGFVKEGYLRRAWQSADGSIHDTLLYAVLREDWLSGSVTNIPACDQAT
jgi:RimJ/RimL family protein N-acetyltransferase